MNFTKSYVLSCLGALGMLAVGQTAQALDLNGKGSSAGRNFAGQVTGAVCAPVRPPPITLRALRRVPIPSCRRLGQNGAAR